MSGRASTVLIADDDDAIRLLCRVNLELEGYRVLEAPDAAGVTAVLADEDPDVLLLDVHLGADDGREVAARVRKERPAIRVAFFTGSVSVDALQDAADAVISKPFRLEELTETVQRLAHR